MHHQNFFLHGELFVMGAKICPDLFLHSLSPIHPPLLRSKEESPKVRPWIVVDHRSEGTILPPPSPLSVVRI